MSYCTKGRISSPEENTLIVVWCGFLLPEAQVERRLLAHKIGISWSLSSLASVHTSKYPPKQRWHAGNKRHTTFLSPSRELYTFQKKHHGRIITICGDLPLLRAYKTRMRRHPPYTEAEPTWRKKKTACSCWCKLLQHGSTPHWPNQLRVIKTTVTSLHRVLLCVMVTGVSRHVQDDSN